MWAGSLGGCWESRGWTPGPLWLAGHGGAGLPSLAGAAGAARWLEGSRLSNQVSGGVPQGEGPVVPLSAGQWRSEIGNEAVPPRIANAAYSHSGYAVGSSRAACGFRLELSGPSKRPGSLTATGWSEPPHLGY